MKLVSRKFVDRLAHDPIHWVRRLKIVLAESLTSWFDHRASSKGAALAFYTLFSMTPILVLAIAVAGYIFGIEAAQGEIVDAVEKPIFRRFSGVVFPPETPTFKF